MKTRYTKDYITVMKYIAGKIAIIEDISLEWVDLI